MTIKEKLKSRKFWLAVAAVGYSVFQNDPKWAALSSTVYIFVQGLIDLAVVKADLPIEE